MAKYKKFNNSIFIFVPDFSIYGLEKTCGYVFIRTTNKNYIHKRLDGVIKKLIKRIHENKMQDRINPSKLYLADLTNFYFYITYDNFISETATQDFLDWYENCKKEEERRSITRWLKEHNII